MGVARRSFTVEAQRDAIQLVHDNFLPADPPNFIKNWLLIMRDAVRNEQVQSRSGRYCHFL